MCHFAFDEVFFRPAEYMTPATFERLAEQALPNAHTLILSARNEPLTSPYFAEILRIAARYRVPELSFITNATRLNPTLAEAIIANGVTDIQISVDGATKKTYEHIRRGANFDKLVSNIRNLDRLKREAGSLLPRLQFNIVLMKSNLDELEMFVDLAESLGVERIAARHLVLVKGLDLGSESLFDEPERANHHLRRFLERADVSPTVRIVGFPDLFDLDQIRRMGPRTRVVFDRPFGVVDLPTATRVDAESTVTLYGWALDAEGLVGVSVEREAFPDDAEDRLNERGLVPLDDARLGGDREDVAAVYPEMPRSRTSGWSVDIRRDRLFGEEGGEVAIHVFAFALDRPVTELGVRRIRFAPATMLDFESARGEAVV
jgi:hypothetical protein